MPPALPPPAVPAVDDDFELIESSEVVEASKRGESSKWLDLSFCVDCTGSMGAYIAAAKQNIERISHALANAQGYDLRLGLVGYRDHPPQDQSYVTKPFPFVRSVGQMRENLAQLSANGGGDGPEAVEAGLMACVEMDWREAATKVVVLIADAPPHGLGERGDGFPNGSPTGVDPLVVLDSLSARGICVYSVGCEPALSNYQFAKDFFVAVAERTNGQAVSLGSASALADVIMGASIEECELEKLTTEVLRQVHKLKISEPGLTSDEVEAKVFRNLQAQETRTQQMQCAKLSSVNAHLVCRAASLPEAKAALTTTAAAAPSHQYMAHDHGLSTLPHPPPLTPHPVYAGADLSLLEGCTSHGDPVYRSMTSLSVGADSMGEMEGEMPTYRSLSAPPPPSMPEAPPAKYRSLGAPSLPVPSSAAMVPPPQETVTITEGIISKEQVSRLLSRGKKKGLWE